MRQRSPSLTTAREHALPASRSTTSERRGMATVSMSCRTVATLGSSRRRRVGGPSGEAGKNDGGRGVVPGISTGVAAGGRGGGGEALVFDAPEGGGPAGGRGGGSGGAGRRGWLTQPKSTTSLFDERYGCG